MLSREEARWRVLQRLRAAQPTAPLRLLQYQLRHGQLKTDASQGLQAYPWYGAGLVGWYLSPDEKQRVLSACDNLANAVADARSDAEKITNAGKKGPYIDQLRAIDQSIAGYRSNVDSIKTKLAYEQALAYLSVAGPKALAVMRPLILADQQDPSGATAEKMMKGQLENISKQQAEIMSSWYMDPEGWLKEQVASAGKTVMGLQWSAIKAFWPILLVGGGIAALWFFGPALTVVARRLSGRLASRVPGELPLGTQHQPGE